jgi:tetratricopeptide (TPR) repeat protein
VAKYKKKELRKLQQDRFRDTTLGFFDRLGDALEGKGRTILYAFGGAILAAIIIISFVKWRNRKADEARQALGRAITIASTDVSATPVASSSEPQFNSEYERANRSIEEFEKVAAKYGDPYRAEARYFIAANRLLVDRPKGLSELDELSKSSVPEVAALSKFALAQAKESDGKLDEAAQLYSDLAKQNSISVSSDTANLRLAKVYTKLGKKKEASDVLFNIVDASRKAKDEKNQPAPISSAAREAATELQKVDPDRYAKLPPETPSLIG